MRVLPFALALLAAQPAPALPERPRVLVLDLQGVDVDPAEAGLLRDAITSRLTRFEELDVVAQGELRRLLEVESSRELLGCDTTACRSEIADALGARYLVVGSLGGLGDGMVLNLTLLRGSSGDAVSRRTIHGATLDDIVRQLPPEVDALAAPLVEEPPPPLLWWSSLGAGALGVGALALGTVWALQLEGTLASAAGAPDGKQQALDQRLFALGTLGAGTALVGVGAAGALLLVPE